MENAKLEKDIGMMLHEGRSLRKRAEQSKASGRNREAQLLSQMGTAKINEAYALAHKEENSEKNTDIDKELE